MVKGGYKPDNTDMLLRYRFQEKVLFFLLFIYIEIRRMKKCQPSRMVGLKVKDGIGRRFVKLFPSSNFCIFLLKRKVENSVGVAKY